MFIIPNLGLNILTGILCILFITFVIIIYGIYNIEYSITPSIVKIYNQQNILNFTDYSYLSLIRFTHYLIGAFGIFTIFIFKPNVTLYIIYCLFFTVVFFNILIAENECCLSYIEKKILDPKYEYNLDRKYEVFKVVLFGNSDIKIVYLVAFSLVIILIRLYKHYLFM